MVLYASLLNHLYLYLHLMLLFQVHANILSAIVGVDWQWKSEVSGIMGLGTAPAGSILEFDLGWRLAAVCRAELSCCGRCTFGASFQEKVYFSLAHPFFVACIMFTVAVIVGRISSSFEVRTTLWLFATVGVYTFGPAVISSLIVVFPCIDGEGDAMMVIYLVTKLSLT